MTIGVKFIIISLLAIVNAFAIDDSIVVIQSVSSSGKTIYLDRGTVDEIGSDDFGVLLIKEEIELGKFVFKPVAKLRAVKVLASSSVWIVYKSYIDEAIKPGNKLVLFAESKLLKGRTNLTVKRTSLVTIDDPTQEVKDFLIEGDDLAVKKEKYKAIEVGHKKEKHLDVDVDLIDVNGWKDTMLDDKVYVDGIYRSPYAKEFSDRKRVQTFEKMVVSFLDKYNDPLFNRKSFYFEQARSGEGMKLNGTFKSYKERKDSELQNKAAKEEKFYRELKAKGDAWSDGYSDDELADLLTNMNIVQEKKRRQGIIAYKYDYQAYFSMGLNIVNNENVNDSETTEQSKYDFEVALETYLLKKFKSLQKFTLEGSFRRAKDAYYGGTLNVRSTEYSLAGQINWYPFTRATAIDTNIYYFSILSRYGFSQLSNVTTSEEGNYQVFTVPGFKVGMKHNFRNTFGFRASLGIENIRAERVIRNADNGTLPDRANYREAKISIGLSKFF